MADVKLTLENVLPVLRRYLPLFLSYRENPARGGGRICPPSGARVKVLSHEGEKKAWPLSITGPPGAFVKRHLK